MNLIGVLKLLQQRPAQSLQWFQGPFRITPLPVTLTAALTGNLANVSFDPDQLDRAAELALESFQLHAEAYSAGDPAALFPQTTLAPIYVTPGDYSTAEPVPHDWSVEPDRVRAFPARKELNLWS
jgi:hypothetical protein